MFFFEHRKLSMLSQKTQNAAAVYDIMNPRSKNHRLIGSLL